MDCLDVCRPEETLAIVEWVEEIIQRQPDESYLYSTLHTPLHTPHYTPLHSTPLQKTYREISHVEAHTGDRPAGTGRRGCSPSAEQRHNPHRLVISFGGYRLRILAD